MFVIRCFNRGDKSELYKVHRVKSLSFNFTENICQGYSWSRGWKNLVGIDVHEPIGLDRISELLFAFKKRRPSERSVIRKLFNCDQSFAKITSCNGHCVVSGTIVNQVRFDSLTEQVFQARGDK